MRGLIIRCRTPTPPTTRVGRTLFSLCHWFPLATRRASLSGVVSPFFLPFLRQYIRAGGIKGPSLAGRTNNRRERGPDADRFSPRRPAPSYAPGDALAEARFFPVASVFSLSLSRSPQPMA